MDNQTRATILQVIERAPQWMRRDLESKDRSIRIRAEEALAAVISNALDAESGEIEEN